MALAGLVLVNVPGHNHPTHAAFVLVAAHDLPAGAVLGAADLRVVSFPINVEPVGVLARGAAVLGRVLSGALRTGEPLTDARLLGPGLLVGSPSGTVAAPVRIADGASVALLYPGAQVDILATSTGASGTEPAGTVTLLATSAVVLALPDATDRGSPGTGGFGLSSAPARTITGLTDGALVVIATTPGTAATLARAAVTARLSVTLVAQGLGAAG